MGEPSVWPVNTQDGSGNTALHRAIMKPDLGEVARLLQSNHIDIEMRNNDFRTPLHLAVTLTTEHLAQTICRLLMAKGARVNATDRYHNDPLHAAAVTGCAWAVRMLLEEGANGILHININGRTPLSLAVERYMNQIMEQAEYSEHSDANGMHIDVDPSTVLVLMEGTIRAHKKNNRFWVDYALSDPIFTFFSNDLPDYVKTIIYRDGLGAFYIENNVIHKYGWNMHYLNLLGRYA
jgi:hypothetical protein